MITVSIFSVVGIGFSAFALGVALANAIHANLNARLARENYERLSGKSFRSGKPAGSKGSPL